MDNLENKNIIITGGSGQLGSEMVKHLVQNKANVLNVDITDNQNCETLICDITNQEDLDKLLIEVKSKFSKIDGLINNAYPRSNDWGIDFLEEPDESWEQNMNLQLNSHVALIKRIAKLMIPNKLGSIVNISSIYGVVGNDMSLYKTNGIKTAAGYSAIKGGIVNLTRYLSAYLGEHNIRVNCVSPGGIFNHQDPDFVQRYNEKVPLGRMGTPEDIAPSVSFLLSDDSKYITGHNLIVDGGWTAI